MMTRTATTLALIMTVVFGPVSIAAAAECPVNPRALGTSRTLTVNPRAFPMVGRAQYGKTLRLNRREVVLTFDNGPSFPYTEVILRTLAEECVKATFFALGSNVVEDPEQIQRIAQEGHSIGTQTFNHVSLAKLPFAAARKEIDEGIKAVDNALQGAKRGPFFRAPMLQLSPQVTRYIASLGMMVWSNDVDSRDWSGSSEEQIVARIMSGLEKAGRGIVVMQDIQPATARALPLLLEQLKRRKFRIVHVVANHPPAKSSTTPAKPRRKSVRSRRN
ncbi:MAG: polysaccharide deacetylase family protein [Rhizobiales bacterium]|nr:polysaccharide deacetylase family protein [Hyphomicrobiales bacterium]